MSVNVVSLFDFLKEFEQSTVKSRRDAKVVMRAGAKTIMADSKLMCPVDEGNLEQAHHITEIRSNVDQLSLSIDVGGFVNGRDVSDYAWVQHETLTPAGPWKLGPKSEEKNSSNPPDMQVGGKFLERAIEMNEDLLAEQITAAILGAFE